MHFSHLFHLMFKKNCHCTFIHIHIHIHITTNRIVLGGPFTSMLFLNVIRYTLLLSKYWIAIKCYLLKEWCVQMEWKKCVPVYSAMYVLCCVKQTTKHSFNIYVLIWCIRTKQNEMNDGRETKMKRKVWNCRNDLRQQWTEFILVQSMQNIQHMYANQLKDKFIQTIDELTENNPFRLVLDWA